MTGALAVSMPISAEDTTITTESYTLVIPTFVTVSDATGFNQLGNGVTVKDCIYTDSVTVTAESANSWTLKSGENSVAYGIYDSSDSENQVYSHTFSENITTPNSETWECGIKLNNYSVDDTPNGTYEDIITWTATVKAQNISFTYDGVTYSKAFGTKMTTFLSENNVQYAHDEAGIYREVNGEKSYMLIQSNGNWHVYEEDYVIEANAIYVWSSVIATGTDTNIISDTTGNIGNSSADSSDSDTISTGKTIEDAADTDTGSSNSAGVGGTSGSATTGNDVSGSTDTTDTAGSTDTGAAASTGVDGTTD